MSNAFLSGAATMGFLVAALFFLKFWRTTGDRLFLYFTAAFLVFTLERIVREVFAIRNEWEPFVYLLRLVGFLLLLLAIIEKNRGRSR
jgi:hypothetical protein